MRAARMAVGAPMAAARFFQERSRRRMAMFGRCHAVHRSKNTSWCDAAADPHKIPPPWLSKSKYPTQCACCIYWQQDKASQGGRSTGNFSASAAKIHSVQ